MLRINKAVALGLPVTISLAAVLSRSLLLFALLFLAHFFIVKNTTAFKGRENLWMFVIVAISGIPFNIYLLYLLNGVDMLFGSILFLGILRCALYYAVLFSVEEVFMGVITRFLWTRQYKLF